MFSLIPNTYIKTIRSHKLLEGLPSQTLFTNILSDSTIFSHCNSHKLFKKFHSRIYNCYPNITNNIHQSCFLDYYTFKNPANNYSTNNMSQTQTVTVVEPESKVDTSVITLKTEKHKEIFRKDYKPPDFIIHDTNLTFHLDYTDTRVTSILEMQRLKGSTANDLILHGDELKCIKVFVDDRELQNVPNDGYTIDEGNLIIPSKFIPTDFDTKFRIKTVVSINPSENKLFMGLFKSNDLFCTQCESEGFRRITYYLDRPDVMSMFKVKIEANKKLFPVLLSNGNMIESGNLDNDRHFAVFNDPFKKPAYLFALVAGPLESISGEFVTKSGNKVALKVFSAPESVNKLNWAMESIKKSMKWDEDKYGLEYDLDNFNIVCVNDFNMGAMENKGLNVFNTDLLLADDKTTTDAEFMRILSVIGHEYFHNWTGNRVTCRDWFQLTLKEGLTVFRESQFIADMWSKAVCRIHDVQFIKGPQFTEDNGPMSHPIRLESYISVNNFYTGTVYEKGAEVIKMYHTILGEEGFRKGIDLYFKRHDGHAVTCDDFLAAMADANNYDFKQFELWYSQSGTPIVEVLESKYLPDKQMYTLTLKQRNEPTLAQPVKHNLHIPIKIGLIGKTSKKDVLSSKIYDDSMVLDLKQGMQTFEIPNVNEDCVLSILRDFSAPVKLVYKQPVEDLSFLMAYDSDPVNRWMASQTLLTNIILNRLDETRRGVAITPIPVEIINSLRGALNIHDKEMKALVLRLPESDNLSMKALVFRLPDSDILSNEITELDPFQLRDVKQSVRLEILGHLKEQLLQEYKNNTVEGNETISKEDIARRAFRNVVFSYLVANKGEADAEMAYNHYIKATKMSDRLCALSHLTEMDSPLTKMALDHFYESANGDIQVIEKWFRIQAFADIPNALDRVTELMGHEKFSFENPNSVRSLLMAFTLNVQFHKDDGSGYRFLSDVILKLDKINSIMAARMAGKLVSWKKYDPKRQQLMVGVLKSLLENKLSNDVYEVVHKAITL